MQVKKYYENDNVVLYITDDELSTCLTLNNEVQMRRLGECLINLARTGGKKVSVGE